MGNELSTFNSNSNVYETGNIPSISWSQGDIFPILLMGQFLKVDSTVLMLWGALGTDVSRRINWHGDFDEVTQHS